MGPILQSHPVPTLFGLANSIVAFALREWLVGTSFELRPVLEGLRCRLHQIVMKRLSLHLGHLGVAVASIEARPVDFELVGDAGLE